MLLKVFDDNDFLIFALSFDSRLRDVIRNVEFTCEDLAHPNNLMRALAAAKYYSKFKLEALDVMINCLVSKRLTHQKDIKGIMDNYKKNYLKPKMEKTLSDFTSDSEICLALQPNELNLALVCPDSPPFSEVKRAQEYLIDKMGIKKVENLRFDFGCVYILLTITYVSNDLQKLLEEFLHHQKYLMEFGIHRVLLVGYWSLDLCDRTVQTLAPKVSGNNIRDVNYSPLCCLGLHILYYVVERHFFGFLYILIAEIFVRFYTKIRIFFFFFEFVKIIVG